MSILGAAALGSYLVSNIASSIGQRKDRDLEMQIAQQNLRLEQEMFKYQQGVQRTTWEREDTAVQRRVDDLRAAGLSPTLAAGSAAGSGQVVATRAPQISAQIPKHPLHKIANMAGILSQVLGVKQQANELLRQKATIGYINEQSKLVNAQIQNATADRMAKMHNLKWYSDLGMPVHSSLDPITRMAGSIISNLDTLRERSKVEKMTDEEYREYMRTKGLQR